MLTLDKTNHAQPQFCPLDIWKHCLKKFNVFHHDIFKTKLYKPSFTVLRLKYRAQFPRKCSVKVSSLVMMKIFQAVRIA